MKKENKIILLTIIGCILLRSLVSFSLDNSYPGGTDTSTHLLRIWLMQVKGILKWNYYFEGGNPVLTIYPPLAYIIAGVIAKFGGFLIGYKLISDLVFLISIILYFIFLKQFKLDNKKIVVALIFFSLLPIHSYYFADGRYPSLLGFVFCLLYWICLKKYFDNNKISDFVLSAIFFSFIVIINHTVAFMILVLTSIWTILYDNKHKMLERISKFVIISLFSFLLSAWWLMPYMLNRLNIEERSSDVSNLLVEKPKITNYVDEIIFRIMNLGIYQSGFVVYTTIIYVVITSIICLFSIFEIKDKTNRNFIIISFLIVVLSIVLKFKRIFIFLPVGLSVVVSYGIFKLKNWVRVFTFCLLLISIIISFLLIKPNFVQNAYFPKLPEDGRFIYIGNESSHYGKTVANNYFYLLSAVQGNENIQGYYLGITYSVFYSNSKMNYGNWLIKYHNMSQDAYYEVLNDGWVNYVVLDKDSDLFNYFNKSSKFRFMHFDNEYSVFETVPKSTYVEINNKSVFANITKLNDEIIINMKCKPGYVTIKETYDKNWKAKLNGEDVILKENNYGFITFENGIDGDCLLGLNVSVEKRDILFLFISIGTYFFALIYVIYGFVKKR